MSDAHVRSAACDLALDSNCVPPAFTSSHVVSAAHLRSLWPSGAELSYCTLWLHVLCFKHTRLDVAVGATVSNSPVPHTACALQLVEPVPVFHEPLAHGEHVVVPAVAAK